MGRDICLATVGIPTARGEVKCTVATSHLESTWQQKEERLRQLTQAFTFLAEDEQHTSEAIYMGDMNLAGYEGKQQVADTGCWKDSWLEKGYTHRNGYTMDGSVNLMMVQYGKNPYKQRLDRVFNRTRHLTLNSIKRIGLESLRTAQDPADLQLWASDHFGLVAEFESRYG
jgi:endonuclease/exonuclease/phosphatase family metal-dependent hydrolase